MYRFPQFIVEIICSSCYIFKFLTASREFVDSVYEKASEDIQKVIKDILWSLFMKMNVPTDEAQKMMNLLEESSMGYLFENMEKMDIQAERQNTKNAKEETEAVRKELAATKETIAEKLILKSQKRGLTKEETLSELQDIMDLDNAQAWEKIEAYWK